MLLFTNRNQTVVLDSFLLKTNQFICLSIVKLICISLLSNNYGRGQGRQTYFHRSTISVSIVIIVVVFCLSFQRNKEDDLKRGDLCSFFFSSSLSFYVTGEKEKDEREREREGTRTTQ